MRLTKKVMRPTKYYDHWELWFAWRPVWTYDEYTDIGAYVWLEHVEHCTSDNFLGRQVSYRRMGHRTYGEFLDREKWRRNDKI